MYCIVKCEARKLFSIYANDDLAIGLDSKKNGPRIQTSLASSHNPCFTFLK